MKNKKPLPAHRWTKRTLTTKHEPDEILGVRLPKELHEAIAARSIELSAEHGTDFSKTDVVRSILSKALLATKRPGNKKNHKKRAAA
jgi:hypothetical protein